MGTMTTQTIQLATGHTASITVHKHADATITYVAQVNDWIGTFRTLAYGECPCARAGYRAASSAIRSFVAMIANRRADGTYSIIND